MSSPSAPDAAPAQDDAYINMINNVTTAHGVLMVVSLAIFLPISVAIAHSMRDTWGPRLWFQIHRGANMAVLLIVTAGVAMGIYLWTQLVPIDETLLWAHMIIGLIIFAFLLAQASAALARPAPTSARRGSWNWAHHSLGYFILLLALANSFIGLYQGSLPWGFYLGTALIWGAIVTAAAAKSLLNRRKGQYPAGTLTRQWEAGGTFNKP